MHTLIYWFHWPLVFNGTFYCYYDSYVLCDRQFLNMSNCWVVENKWHAYMN